MLPVKTTICQCWDPRLLGQEAHAAPRGDAEQPCPPGQAGSSCLCRSTKACLEKCSSDIPSQNGRELHEPPMSRSCNVICYSFLWQNWQNVGMIQFLIQNLMMTCFEASQPVKRPDALCNTLQWSLSHVLEQWTVSHVQIHQLWHKLFGANLLLIAMGKRSAPEKGALGVGGKAAKPSRPWRDRILGAIEPLGTY